MEFLVFHCFLILFHHEYLRSYFQVLYFFYKTIFCLFMVKIKDNISLWYCIEKNNISFVGGKFTSLYYKMVQDCIFKLLWGRIIKNIKSSGSRKLDFIFFEPVLL